MQFLATLLALATCLLPPAAGALSYECATDAGETYLSAAPCPNVIYRKELTEPGSFGTSSLTNELAARGAASAIAQKVERLRRYEQYNRANPLYRYYQPFYDYGAYHILMQNGDPAYIEDVLRKNLPKQ